LDIDIERVRQLLPNSRVAELIQRYHLQYNAVSAASSCATTTAANKSPWVRSTRRSNSCPKFTACPCWTSP
jgi:hypothetical protein